MKIHYSRFLTLALAIPLMGGCSLEEDARITASGHKFHDTVVMPLLQATGDAMVAYGNGVAQYDAQHGTITATSIQYGPGLPVTTYIHY